MIRENVLLRNITDSFVVLLVFIFASSFTTSAAAKTYKIGLLVDYRSPDFKPMFDQLAHEIIAVVGNSATIEFQATEMKVNDFDVDLARKQYLSMLESDTDIILAFGPVNNEVISHLSVHQKPTILFGTVNTDVISIDPNKKVSGVDNFTYVVVPSSYKKDLQDFQSIYPFKRVGVVGAYQPWESEQLRQSLTETFVELGAEYEIIGYQSLSQFAESIGNVDAIYMAEGFGIPYAEIKQMAKLLIEKKLPSFTSTQVLDVENGWLATNQSDAYFERLFRRMAISVEAVINGENLSLRPVYVDTSDTITMNYNTAERIDLPIRFSQIATTNVVGDFEDIVVDQSYTVLEAVEAAIKNNLSLQSNKMDVVLSEENLSSAKTTYYPDLSATVNGRRVDTDLAKISGGNNPERTISTSLNFSQTLYSEDGNAAIGIQKSLLHAQQENYTTSVLDTILNTSQASFNLLRLKNALQSQAENLDITKRNLRIAEQNFEAGQSSKSDIFRFRSEMAKNMQSLIDAANDYEKGQHLLNSLLNNPIEYRIGIRDMQLKNGPFGANEFGYQKLNETLDNPIEQNIFQNFLIVEALKVRPELASLSHRLQSIERDMAQYGWRRFIPTVSATAQYNHIIDRNGVGVPDPNVALNNDYNVGLVFSIPIFNRGSDNVSLRQAIAKREQVLLQIANQKQSVETSIRNSVLDLSGRIANIHLSKVSETAAKQSLELIEVSYATGAVTITDLIDSQNNYLQAQLSSSNAHYNFLDSAVTMERAMGEFLFLDNQSNKSEDFIQRYEEFRQEANDQRGQNNVE